MTALAEINAAADHRLLELLGSVFEHSPWVAQRAAAARPFNTLEALHRAMMAAVMSASPAEQLALICAHPELAGREAVAGTLTVDSSGEQGRLGLTSLARAEFERISTLNRDYREKFGFPCIVALKLHHTRETVFSEMAQRLANDRGTEIANALAQIGHITHARLEKLLGATSMGRLTTHVLDTAQGRPAAGMTIEFSVREAAGWRLLKTMQSNGDGRTDEPLLADDALRAGEYQLLFHVGDYFRRAGVALPQPAFLDRVPIVFGIADAGAHYHVPLLCSPWSYSTYRGS